MSKTILFFADGTWNSPGQDQDKDGIADPTNVFKMFENLDGVVDQNTPDAQKEQEKSLTANGTTVQVAKYIHGVGHSQNPLGKILGGGAGAGLVARIVRGYTFISRNWTPHDRIMVVGFSRGAYTARALAGLINARGLLDARKLPLHDRERAYQLGSDVWFDYRREALATKQSKLARITEIASGLKGFLTGGRPAELVPGVQIDAVAVWDTVGALGIPKYTADATRADGFEFADCKLSDNVRRGLHAVAIDEQRGDFTPTLWNEDSRVTQVLFPGAHSDVGGGYPKRENHCGLSDGALRWMMTQLDGLQVKFAANPPHVPAPNAREGVGHQPWLQSPWDKFPHALRKFARHHLQDPSVAERMGCGSVKCEHGPLAPYKPENLPV